MDYTMLTAPNGTPGSLATWLNNSRIQADLPEIVLEAESWVYRRLRHWRMLSSPITGTMTVGADTIAFPSNFLEPKILTITGVNQQILTQVSPENIVASWSYDGTGARVQQQPFVYSFNGDGFVLDSPPDQAYPYATIGYVQPAPLATTISNFLTIYYPRLLRVACMAACCEWAKDFGQGDANRMLYDAKALDEIDKAQAESDRARHSQEAPTQLIGGGGYGYPGGLPAYGGT